MLEMFFKTQCSCISNDKLIKCIKFGDNRLVGLGLAESLILVFFVDFAGRP